jgi:DNA modification methylase
LQFNKQRHFDMYQEAVMVPAGLWGQRRRRDLSAADKVLVEAKTRATLGRKIAHWVRRDMAYPTNVLRLATEYSSRDRHDVFPPALPEWFIRLFTKPGDLVLDPFVGSGTSVIVAKSMNRRCIGIDSDPERCALTEAQLAQIEAVQMDLM